MTWRELNDSLYQLSENETLMLLENEKQTLKRLSILVRLHQRYTVLRANRERLELLGLAKNN